MENGRAKSGFWTRVIFVALAVGVTIILVGCPGSPAAGDEEEKAAKEFEPQDNNSVIYIYRSTMVAAIQMFRLYIDGSLIGDSKNGSFFRIVAKPGMHALEVTNMRNDKLGNVSINTDASKLYYIELQVGANPISGIPKLVLTEEQKAKPKIKQCKLLKTGTTAMDK
ncbi:MAG: DUF2846 domain-containing protein [Planctomycetota bacterium]